MVNQLLYPITCMKFIKIFLVLLLIGLSAHLLSHIFSQNQKVEAADNLKPYLVEVVAQDGSKTEYSGRSVRSDIFTIATDLGATPYPEDKISVFPDIDMGIGGKITVLRAPTYTVYDGKNKLVFRSWQKTVGALFTEKNIELANEDKVNFPLNFALEPNQEIKITRVAIATLEKKQAIDFPITKKNDNTLDKGKTRVEMAGVAGERTLTYQIRREDGIEVSRTLVKNEITVQPVVEILIIGTKPVITGWCKFNDMVLDASTKNGFDPDKLCALMHVESNGHPDSSGQGGAHQGLFQYDPGFWSDVSAKAGYSGADIWDAKAQIYVTAWALMHGYAGRW